MLEKLHAADGREQGEMLPLRCRALFDYQARDETELCLAVGHIFDIVDEIGLGWAKVVEPYTDAHGLAPRNHLESLPDADGLERVCARELKARRPADALAEIHEPNSVALEDGKLYKAPPILGTVKFDFQAEECNELSVFYYDYVQVLKQLENHWAYVRLLIPDASEMPEGFVPDRYISIQQFSPPNTADTQRQQAA